MLIYFFLVILCLFPDFLTTKKNKILRYIIISLILIILCFGYMVGSDWRGYEMIYNGNVGSSFGRYENHGEYGFIFIVNLFNKFIPDFWIFNALFKIFYTIVLVRFFSNFTKYKWVALGISILAGSTLFMVVDCPMRFMVGSTFLLLGIIFYLNKHYREAVIFILISPLFHKLLIVVILLLLTYKLSTKFWDINRWVLLTLYIALNYVILYTSIYDYIYFSLIPFLGMDTFIRSYEFTGVDSFLQLGNLKELILLIIFLISKSVLEEKNYGKLVYYFTIIYFFLSLILRCIPTGFRLAIFMGYFVSIYLTIIYSSINFRTLTYRNIGYYSIILVLIVVMARTLDKSFSYLPYSNSIPYIINGHLPYEYRTTHNLYEYQERKGKRIYLD